jgi:hypothetical protein
MIVYGMNRLPLAQESNEELALTTGAQSASGTSAAVPTHVAAEGSGGENTVDGGMHTEDEDDSRPPIKK